MTVPTLDPQSVEHLLTSSVLDLSDRFTGIFSTETVDRCVRESYQTLYRTARFKNHLPVLADRFAAERLTAVAQATGKIDKAVPETLFVCVHNAGRSQMAAALLHHMAEGRVHVRSAGSLPASEINPAVTEAMTEVGLDLTHEFPKPLTDDVVQAADVVITMGCGDACPIYPGKRYLDWALPDPDDKPLEVVRSLRDQIHDKVRDLLNQLVPNRITEPKGNLVADKPTVLFVCVHNAGRSQMAAGYLTALAGDRVQVLSAGSEPADQINPVAVQAMAEVGIDIRSAAPKILTTEAVKASDVVITMGCGDTCPIFPGKRYEDWDLDDPAGRGIDAVRPIRDDIKNRIQRLLDELLPARNSA